jgi:senataxin
MYLSVSFSFFYLSAALLQRLTCYHCDGSYFGAFSDSILTTFWAAFDKWECQLAIGMLERAMPTSAPSSLTLEDMPIPLVTLVLSNTAMMLDPILLTLIRSSLPSWPLDKLPMNPPPTCLWYLSMDEDFQVRQWAKQQIALCKEAPLSVDAFKAAYDRSSLMDDVIGALGGKGKHNSVHFPFTVESGALWSAFVNFVRLLPSELLKNRDHSRVNVAQVIIGHLHDHKDRQYFAHFFISPSLILCYSISLHTDFQDVLKCFLYLLQRLGGHLWQDEKPEYPQVVFDAIKDNPAYLETIASTIPGTDKPWHLSWYTEYLQSIWKHSNFSEILARVTAFVCEELQHERFNDVRPIAMVIAVRVRH